ncbi:MAG TPA: hypothetical protein ENK05_07590 [Gammaproteobacteria bacterium]|nr:hypothetical protein [Gammaproteobacteria bacterium]
MDETTRLLILAVSWILYGTIHSLLASHAVKAAFRRRFPSAFRGYRLAYNLLATVLLLPPLWLLYSYPGKILWHWPEPVRWAADALALAAAVGFLWSARGYDTREFLGLSQLSRRDLPIDDQAPMSISPAHRFVRHPWYFLGLVILWTREMNAAFLLSAVVLTLYLWVGSRLEERKLLICYGEPYRRYRRRVPGLVPLPWRHLSREQAQELLAMDRSGTCPGSLSE